MTFLHLVRTLAFLLLVAIPAVPQDGVPEAGQSGQTCTKAICGSNIQCGTECPCTGASFYPVEAKCGDCG
jgi:hypothetical protein